MIAPVPLPSGVLRSPRIAPSTNTAPRIGPHTGTRSSTLPSASVVPPNGRSMNSRSLIESPRCWKHCRSTASLTIAFGPPQAYVVRLLGPLPVSARPRMRSGSSVSTRGPSSFSPKPRTLCEPPAYMRFPGCRTGSPLLVTPTAAFVLASAFTHPACARNASTERRQPNRRYVEPEPNIRL